MAMSVFLESKRDDIPENLCDDLVDLLNDIESKQGNKMYVVDPKRAKECMDAYSNLKRIFGSRYAVRGHKRTDGGITAFDMFVTGKDIEIDNTDDLIDSVLCLADCFEVSAYENDTVELAITFYGFLKKVGV